MKENYVSFDVFDTCLVRRCGLPYKIWDLMADKLFPKDDLRSRLSFTGNRRIAERIISKYIPYPTLDDIYKELNVAQWGLEQSSIMNLEMEIEDQELFPNLEILKKVNQYREKGFKIAFVSDMYLPTEFIRKVLAKNNFCHEKDLVFVSAYCKASKNDGKLFNLVLKETHTKAKQWLHYGDNERSDCRVPRSKGMKVHLVSGTNFTDEEKRWIDDARFYAHKHEIELWAGLCRLTRLQNKRSFAATMAVDFIASVYVPYVAYVLRTAKEKEIKTLYFLARDGHIFLEIAKAMKAESEGIECRYLKVSRRALYSCAFYEVNDFELSMTIGAEIGNSYKSVKNTLSSISIEYENLSNETKKMFAADYVLRTKSATQKFIDTLKKNDAELLKKESVQKRKNLLGYLKQECLLENQSALVDLGWTGTCRIILNYILQKETKKNVTTFYWGYNSDLLYGKDFGKLYIFNKQYDHVLEYSCGNLFFEKYASVNAGGSTLGYEYNETMYNPIEGVGDESLQRMMDLNEFMVKSQVLNMSNILFSQEAFFDIFLCCGLRQEINIIKKPTKKIMDFFDFIRFENYDVNVKMVRRLPLKDLLALLVWGTPASMIWEEAAIKKSFGPFAGAFTRLYQYTSKTAFANKLRLWWVNRN